MPKFTFSSNITLGNIISVVCYIVVVVYAFARLEAKIDAEMDKNTLQDQEIVSLDQTLDVTNSRVQRNSEKFIGAEAAQEVFNLRVTTTEHLIKSMDAKHDSQMEKVLEKFEELKELVIQLQYR